MDRITNRSQIHHIVVIQKSHNGHQADTTGSQIGHKYLSQRWQGVTQETPQIGHGKVTHKTQLGHKSVTDTSEPGHRIGQAPDINSSKSRLDSVRHIGHKKVTYGSQLMHKYVTQRPTSGLTLDIRKPDVRHT